MFNLLRKISVYLISVFLIGPRNDFIAAQLIRDMYGLYFSGKYSDIVLLSKDGLRYPCHRSILAARSPFFAEKFDAGGIPEINLDIDSVTLKIFLKFIYAAILEENSIRDNNFSKMYLATKKLKLSDLQNTLKVKFLSNITEANVFEGLILGYKCPDQQIEEECYTFLTRIITDTFLEREPWLSFERENPDIANKVLKKLASRRNQ